MKKLLIGLLAGFISLNTYAGVIYAHLTTSGETYQVTISKGTSLRLTGSVYAIPDPPNGHTAQIECGVKNANTSRVSFYRATPINFMPTNPYFFNEIKTATDRYPYGTTSVFLFTMQGAFIGLNAARGVIIRPVDVPSSVETSKITIKCKQYISK
ncbi:hypothetical protein LCGC14_0924400 [marine sediment metagenome]|uniref:Uncharacterized protein n=1 Tax=marine sediment metagenome TaxID=412755 RepID=A0A0F9RWF4_9ZZZZ